MSHVSSFVWALVSTFLFLAYIMVMFQIVTDLFRDTELSGWTKAVWIAGLIFLPVITALIYVIRHGKDMSERQREASLKARVQAESYVRDVAGTGAADQIVKAKSLLDAGAISQAEFLTLKGKVLT